MIGFCVGALGDPLTATVVMREQAGALLRYSRRA